MLMRLRHLWETLTPARPLASSKDGYVQAVDYYELVALAESEDLVLRPERRPGDNLIEGTTLATSGPQNASAERARPPWGPRHQACGYDGHAGVTR
jgi:hypothetical protein